ncbi:MAG: DUF1376 domain-containing protein [Pseudomonadota bacterium]
MSQRKQVGTPPYLPLYVKDYEARAAHLTMEEDGAYMRLLRLCWMSPGCSIPDDEAWIRRRMRATDQQMKDVILPLIEEFMKRKKGRIVQENLLESFSKYSDTISARKKSGKKGGVAKALKNRGSGDEFASDLPVAKSKQNLANHNHNHNHKDNNLIEPDSSKINTELNSETQNLALPDGDDGEKSPPPPHPSKYAFEGFRVRLTHDDYGRWKRAYKKLDLDAALQNRDDWYRGGGGQEKNHNWFQATSNWLANQNAKAAKEKQEERQYHGYEGFA